jgi:hypothetical protein
MMADPIMGLGLEINPILNSLQAWRSELKYITWKRLTQSQSIIPGKSCDEIGMFLIILFRATLDGFRKYKGVVIVDWLMEIRFSILSGQSRRYFSKRYIDKTECWKGASQAISLRQNEE